MGIVRMFAAIQPRSQTMPCGQPRHLIRESNGSSWGCTDVTCVVSSRGNSDQHQESYLAAPG